MDTINRNSVLLPTIRLLVTKGGDEGKILETSSFPILIGRDGNNDFPLKKDTNISRIHAEINIKARKLWLTDMGSTNGSIVNNVRVKNKAEISNGSVIILGKTWIKISLLRGPKREKTEDSNDSTFVYNSKLDEAFLVLDQCNSSQIIDVYGDEMGMRLTEAMNKLVLPVFKKYNVQFTKGTGDGYLATFKHPGVCIQAAEDIISRIKRWNKKSAQSTEIHVRLGLHYGQAHIEPNGDRHGQAVHITFRVEGLKYKDIKKSRYSIGPRDFPSEDRVFITKEFFERLDERKQAKCSKLGFFKLKGIKGYYEILLYEV
jgi:class 3 adenylate cyclase